MKQGLKAPKRRAGARDNSWKDYRLLFADHPQPMWVFDSQSLKFLDVNKAAVMKYGYTREEFLNMTVKDIQPPEDMDKQTETVKTRNNLQFSGELRHRLKDGRIIHMEIASCPLERGKRILVVANDITARKAAEKDLQDSLKRYHGTLDNMLEGCQIIDFDWRYVYINEAAARQGHRRRDELLMRTMMEAYLGIENTELFSILERCMQERTAHKMENKFHNPDGSVGWFELSIEPVPEGLFILSIEITERKLAEEKTHEQLARVTALREIDRAILSSFDLQFTLMISLKQVMDQLKVDAADVMLLDPVSNTLRQISGKGFRRDTIGFQSLSLGDGYASRVVLDQQIVYIPDLSETNFTRAQLVQDEGFVSYIGTPLVVKGKIRGVLEVFHRSPFEPNQEWFHFFDILAGQIAIAVDNATLYLDLQRSNSELMLAYEATLEGWTAALDLRDRETEGHTRRVTFMTLELCKELGLTDDELLQVRRGALLHDIGKMGVPDQILLKPAELTEEEWGHMRMHPVFAYNMLSPIAYLRDSLDIPYYHHEKWDGVGYPRGLKGEEIPLAARIFAVADVYDALTSDRPYRKAWSREKTLDYIQGLSGVHFDPRVVEAFLKMLSEKK